MEYENLRLKDELHQKLYEDQQRALKEIESFLDSPDENVFILSGPKLAGKSFLINSINISATKKGFEPRLFTISHHVIETLINSNFRNESKIKRWKYRRRQKKLESELKEYWRKFDTSKKEEKQKTLEGKIAKLLHDNERGKTDS